MDEIEIVESEISAEELLPLNTAPVTPQDDDETKENLEDNEDETEKLHKNVNVKKIWIQKEDGVSELQVIYNLMECLVENCPSNSKEDDVGRILKLGQQTDISNASFKFLRK